MILTPLKKSLAPVATQPNRLFYIGKDNFTTNQSAPMPSIRNAEPGPGVWVKGADTNNRVSIASSKIRVNGAAANSFVDPGYYLRAANGGGFERLPGMVALFKNVQLFTNTSRAATFGLLSNLSFSVGVQFGYYFPAGAPITIRLGTSTPTVGPAYVINTLYQLAIQVHEVGYSYYIKGGIYTNWRLLFFDDSLSDATLWPYLAGVSTSDYEIDDIHLVYLPGPLSKVDSFVTLSQNPAVNNTDYVTTADGYHDLAFTSPVSPAAGNSIEFRYRIQDSNNYWVIRAVRNAGNTNYDLFVDVVTAGVPANQITVNNVGALNRLRVSTFGTQHIFQARASSTWSASLFTILTNSSFQAATGIKVVTSGSFTLGKLQTLPREHSMYDTLLNSI